MSKINIMSEDLANKIAAGEVVEKTMNVVKELVENSIDAQATIIKISLIDSGVKEIKVVDDGVGMDREDATLCFSRHATSKLHSLNDLFNISSLGFRGEALPSIASVSKVLLQTSNGEVGTEVLINGGKLLQVGDSPIRKGTSITVSNLFYNTPVRLKYLRSLWTELANITDYVNKMALSYPNIKFVLVNNEKELLNTDGSGNLLKVINAIYGLATTKKMVLIEGKTDDFQIVGYMSYPEVSRSNRNSITILVNNRVVKNQEVIKTICEGYHTYIPEDRFPVFVINIIADPYLIDVNIHPTKMDVKFSKIDDLKNLIFTTIQKELQHMLLIPEIDINTENVLKDISSKKVPEVYYESPNDKNVEELKFAFSVNDENETYLKNREELNDVKKSDIGIKQDGDILVINKNVRAIKPIHPVGVVYNTYIIGENEDGMYIIDQHAAAERINYEKCYKALTNHSANTIDLLIPITIELPSNDYIILKEHFDILDRLNFKYEEFGINTLVIRSHPTWLKDYNLNEAIRKIIDIIIHTEDFSARKFNERLSMTMACRMSIKAHDALTQDDMEYLLNTLITMDNPWTCPHGRPTIITYSKYDLEKLFKRSI